MNFFGIEPGFKGLKPFFNRGGKACRIISDNVFSYGGDGIFRPATTGSQG
jgi:hypothetical protein